MSYRPTKIEVPSLGIQCVELDIARAHVELRPRATQLMNLARLHQLLEQQYLLAQQGLCNPDVAMPMFVQDLASRVGFALTPAASIRNGVTEAANFLAWKAAAFMRHASGFQPDEQFFAIIPGQPQVHLVHGIGGARVEEGRLNLVSTREFVCTADGGLQECPKKMGARIFDGYRSAVVHLFPDVWFMTAQERANLVAWARAAAE